MRMHLSRKYTEVRLTVPPMKIMINIQTQFVLTTSSNTIVRTEFVDRVTFQCYMIKDEAIFDEKKGTCLDNKN